MTQISRAALKAFFETHDQPTAQQFADFIDSVYNFADDGPVPTPPIFTSLKLSVSQVGYDDPTIIEVANSTGSVITAGNVGSGIYYIFANPPLFADMSKVVCSQPSANSQNKYILLSNVDEYTMRIDLYKCDTGTHDDGLANASLSFEFYP